MLTNLWEMNNPVNRTVLVCRGEEAERQILSDSVSSISIEECFMWACLLDTALVFWQKVPLNFLWPPIIMYNDKGISTFLSRSEIIIHCKVISKAGFCDIRVLWCNSILSESCLVSTNKLAWLRPPRSPDPRLWYGALSSGNEIINIILASREDSLWNMYYCKIGSWEDLTEIFVEKKQFARNNLQQMVNTF